MKEIAQILDNEITLAGLLGSTSGMLIAMGAETMTGVAPGTYLGYGVAIGGVTGGSIAGYYRRYD